MAKYTAEQIDRVIDALIEMSACRGFWVHSPLQRVAHELLRETGRGDEVDQYDASGEAERYVSSSKDFE